MFVDIFDNELTLSKGFRRSGRVRELTKCVIPVDDDDDDKCCLFSLFIDFRLEIT